MMKYKKSNLHNKYNTTPNHAFNTIGGITLFRSKACTIEAHGACLGYGYSHKKCRCQCHNTNTQESHS